MLDNNNQYALTLSLINESLKIHTHYQLLNWLQGGIQKVLPHQILISAWGDFSLELIEFDVVANDPLIRTSTISNSNAEPIIVEIFELWQSKENKPLLLNIEENSINFKKLIQLKKEQASVLKIVKTLTTALVHGVKDQRGSYDSLYILLSQNKMPNDSTEHFSIFMPFIDCAFRQVDTLEPSSEDVKVLDNKPQAEMLTKRECEIMDLVRKGQSNIDIGQSLNISMFTVKNHLQRIFRKIDAANRSQATFKYEKLIDPNKPSSN